MSRDRQCDGLTIPSDVRRCLKKDSLIIMVDYLFRLTVKYRSVSSKMCGTVFASSTIGSDSEFSFFCGYNKSSLVLRRAKLTVKGKRTPQAGSRRLSLVGNQRRAASDIKSWSKHRFVSTKSHRTVQFHNEAATPSSHKVRLQRRRAVATSSRFVRGPSRRGSLYAVV